MTSICAEKEDNMRTNNVQSLSFSHLQVRTRHLPYISESSLERCRTQLSKTKHVDVVIDPHGFAIKEKMTDILQRIQSFSLFMLENALGLNVKTSSNENKTYKFKFATIDEARKIWKDFYETSGSNSLEGYTKIALWLDEHLGEKMN